MIIRKSDVLCNKRTNSNHATSTSVSVDATTEQIHQEESMQDAAYLRIRSCATLQASIGKLMGMLDQNKVQLQGVETLSSQDVAAANSIVQETYNEEFWCI